MNLKKSQNAVITAESDRKFMAFRKALKLSIPYSSSIGGTGTLIGTGPNIVFKGQLEAWVAWLASPRTDYNFILFNYRKTNILAGISWHHCIMVPRYTTVPWCHGTPLYHGAEVHPCTMVPWCHGTPLYHGAEVHHCLYHGATVHHCTMVPRYTAVPWCHGTPLYRGVKVHHCTKVLR